MTARAVGGSSSSRPNEYADVPDMFRELATLDAEQRDILREAADMMLALVDESP